MYALVDAVSFYASAEKVFDPSVRDRPVIVLSNNDGNVIAVCPIARRLGIPKFEPYFKIKHLIDRYNVVVRSSNFELYSSLSERMLAVINRYSDNHYVYSIDESFLHLEGFEGLINNWYDYGAKIRRAVWLETGLPVAVGLGSTPTLAKCANFAAKKLDGFRGIAVIDSETSRKSILNRMDVTDVWGIGSRLGSKLRFMGVKSALDLASQDPKYIRRCFSVVVERTVLELNGITCLSWDEVRQNKKEIFSTRSFGVRITDFDALSSALVSHGMSVAKKLRKQGSLAKNLYIFASTSVHEEQVYKKSLLHSFEFPTSDSLVMANSINSAALRIFKPFTRFARCGVGAFNLVDGRHQQYDLFSESKDKPALMACLDDINQRFGSGTLTLAKASSETWKMKQEFLSPRYTTRWSDIPVIKCD